MLCGWRVKAGMPGKTVWSPCYHGPYLRALAMALSHNMALYKCPITLNGWLHRNLEKQMAEVVNKPPVKGSGFVVCYIITVFCNILSRKWTEMFQWLQLRTRLCRGSLQHSPGLHYILMQVHRRKERGQGTVRNDTKYRTSVTVLCTAAKISKNHRNLCCCA